MGAIVVLLLGLNVATLLRHSRRTSVSDTELFCELLFDVAALTGQLYFSGGAWNPFVSLYLLQVILGAVLFGPRIVWSLVGITALCFAGLTAFHRPMPLPRGGRPAFLDLHVQGMFICFLLVAVLLVFFVARISGNLAARDAGLAELRRRAVEEDHIVRMGLLASGAAHELGTPLATLSVILSDWRKMPALRADADMSAEMDEMQGQLDRCKAIVSGILVSAGEARGEGTVHTTQRRFFDEIAAEWREARGASGLVYENRFAQDIAIVSDLTLKQVVFNLLDNALEASAERIALTVEQLGEDLAVRITDDGPGFAPDVLARIGRPYVSTKERPGAGLGLFLTMNVVRKLGGQVEARNSEEHGRHGGASVTIRLPLASIEENTP